MVDDDGVKSTDKITPLWESLCVYQQVNCFLLLSVLLRLELSNFLTSICSSITWQQFGLLQLFCFSVAQASSIFPSTALLEFPLFLTPPQQKVHKQTLSSLYLLLLLKWRKWLLITSQALTQISFEETRDIKNLKPLKSQLWALSTAKR